MKKQITLLHIYHDLMNLYGDWANVAVLERELSKRGFEVVINKKSVSNDINFDLCDFIYIGSGTERSQIACMRDLMRYKEEFLEKINVGTPVLATGNSHELFGQTVTDSNAKRHEMLGVLDFETVQINTRITGDCICKVTFLEDKLIGFINRAGGSQKGNIERPFYVEPREGASYTAGAEGIRYNNLLGTYMTGPVLVRNPPLLRYFADMLTGVQESRESGSESIEGGEFEDLFFKYQEQAYVAALSGL